MPITEKKSSVPKRKEAEICRGLTSEEVLRSREEQGDNLLTTQKQKSFLRHFFENLGDPVIRILLCALVVNLIFAFRGGDPVESIGIAVSVFLATLISTLSERGSEKAFRRLSEACDRVSVKVRRDGQLQEILMGELVVGDLVFLEAGEQIPADGLVVQGWLGVDQSAMTGENKELRKIPSTDRSCRPDSPSAVFRGCPVLSGKAEVVITAVGDHTFLGRIAEEVQISTRESPLKIRLARLAKQISRLGYCAAGLVAFAYLFNTFLIDSGFHGELILMKLKNLPYLFEHLLHAFMLGLTVVVVAVPEGLPMMVAVVLSSNIRRMIRDQVLVRKPVGIETAGSMNLLFTDKTGTLTQGKMSVGKILLPGGQSFSSYQDMQKKAPMTAELYCLSCWYNTAAMEADGKSMGGNATDRALLESVISAPKISGWQIRQSIPFDSAKKLSAVRLTGNGSRVLVKGAPERLLPYMTYAYDEMGRCVPFKGVSYHFLKQVGELTASGGRVLFLAEGQMLTEGGNFGDLTLICAVLLCDRLRKEAGRSVKELKGAGIQVVMITGDNRDTAKHIAGECGILTVTQNLVLTSEEMAKLSDKQLKEVLPKLAVVARALPTDKSRLVRIAQETQRVVGMTGDGINDAPALKRADIGFAMGTGTQVARDAGDIIILDNNLSSIAKAVLYGRNIFKSIRKFITLQLTMNFCAVGVSMICPFLGIDAPVTVVQMLWINIVMDTLGGLAFAGEVPLPSCMKEKPKKRDEAILNSYMIHQILVSGCFTIGLCLAFLLLPAITCHFRNTPNRLCLLTAFFALFIFTSVFHCFNARTDRLRLFSGISRNPAFLTVMALVCAVQILFVYLGGSVLRTMPLTPSELGYTMLLSLSVFPAELLRKLLWRLKGKNQGF